MNLISLLQICIYCHNFVIAVWNLFLLWWIRFCHDSYGLLYLWALWSIFNLMSKRWLSTKITEFGDFCLSLSWHQIVANLTSLEGTGITLQLSKNVLALPIGPQLFWVWKCPHVGLGWSFLSQLTWKETFKKQIFKFILRHFNKASSHCGRLFDF